MFHPIDLQGWEQRDTFTHFMQAGCVYSLTRELCVTAFRRYTKEKRPRFFSGVYLGGGGGREQPARVPARL